MRLESLKAKENYLFLVLWKWEVLMIFLLMFFQAGKLLEMHYRSAIFLHFSNKSHFFVASQIICLKNIKQVSHLFSCTLWVWYIDSTVLTEYTSCILWHTYQLATNQARSQLKPQENRNIELLQNFTGSYRECIFSKCAVFSTLVISVSGVFFDLSTPRRKFSGKEDKNSFFNSLLKPSDTQKIGTLKMKSCYQIVVFSNHKNYLKFFIMIYVAHIS